MLGIFWAEISQKEGKPKSVVSIWPRYRKKRKGKNGCETLVGFLSPVIRSYCSISWARHYISRLHTGKWVVAYSYHKLPAVLWVWVRKRGRRRHVYIVWSAAIRFTSNAIFPSSIVCVPVAIRRAVGIHARLGSDCVRANNKIIHHRAERKKTYNNKRLLSPHQKKRKESQIQRRILPGRVVGLF